MDDPLLVCRLECVGDLARDIQRFSDGETTGAGAAGRCGSGDPLREGLSLHQFQHETAHAVRLFDAIDGADVRVIQGGEHPRLPLEARAAIRVRRERRRQDLDRHLAIECLVVRTVDLAHAANAEECTDRVRPEARANESASYGLECRGSGQLRCRHTHERLSAGLLREQRLDLASQFVIVPAGVGEERRALLALAGERGVTEFLNLPPAVRYHHGGPLAVPAGATVSRSSSRD